MKSTHRIPTPPTYEAGTRTIDTILVSPTLNNVTKAGWLPFGDGVGDHRIAYIDIDADLVLNKDKHEIVPIRARRLQIKNEKSVKRYLELVEPQFRKHNLLERLNNIRKKTNGEPTNEMIKEIEEIDRIRTEILLKSERKCRKINNGTIAYSPEDVQKYGQLIRFWGLVLKKKQKRRISSRLLQRMAKRIGITEFMKNSPEDIIEFRKQAWKKYKNNKRTARERRREFLRRRLLQHETDENDIAATAVMAISKAEELRDAYKEIKGVLKPRTISSLNYIEVDDEDHPGQTKILHDKERRSPNNKILTKDQFYYGGSLKIVLIVLGS